ncbi:MAG: hypothetical protein Q9188_001631 [Gyalolechia gomerana]
MLTRRTVLANRSITSTETPLAVLLLTPSHLKLLGEDDTFIPDLLSQTHENLTRGQELDVLLAVVDKISYPGYNLKLDALREKCRQDIGYSGNGVSVLLLDSESAAPDLWAERSLTDPKDWSHTSRRSTLAFQFNASGTSLLKTGRPPLRGLNLSKTIKLPVANTIFNNGRLSTVKAQRWIVDEKVTGSTLRCAKSKWLDQQVLKVPESNWFPLRDGKDLSSPRDIPFATTYRQQRLRIILPLKRITRPRVVAAAMGNVVRSLFAKSSSGEVIPASQELEARIDRWISESGTETQPVEVWALVSPKKDRSLDAPFTFRDCIDAGSHFHKVLSGGGGWGNRQGLLALDPELDFDDASELTSVKITESVDQEVERRRNLGQIVDPGDTVDFFVRDPKAPFSTPSPTQNARDDSYEFSKLASTVFGTIPSTVDQMSALDTTIADESQFSPCIYAWGHFGMLSEQGMSLTTTTANGQSMQTKIDVPYTTFSLEAGRIPQPKRFSFEWPNNSIAEHEFQVNEVNSQTHRSVVNAGPSAPQPTSEYLLSAQGPSIPEKQDTEQKFRKIAAAVTFRRVRTDKQWLYPRKQIITARRKVGGGELEDSKTRKKIRITKYAVRDVEVDQSARISQAKKAAARRGALG